MKAKPRENDEDFYRRVRHAAHNAKWTWTDPDELNEQDEAVYAKAPTARGRRWMRVWFWKITEQRKMGFAGTLTAPSRRAIYEAAGFLLRVRR